MTTAPSTISLDDIIRQEIASPQAAAPGPVDLDSVIAEELASHEQSGVGYVSAAPNNAIPSGGPAGAPASRGIIPEFGVGLARGLVQLPGTLASAAQSVGGLAQSVGRFAKAIPGVAAVGAMQVADDPVGMALGRPVMTDEHARLATRLISQTAQLPPTPLEQAGQGLVAATDPAADYFQSLPQRLGLQQSQKAGDHPFSMEGIASAVGENVPQLAVQLAAAYLTGGESLAGRALAFGASAAPMELGGAQQSGVQGFEAQGVPHDEAIVRSSPLAAMQAAVNTIIEDMSGHGVLAPAQKAAAATGLLSAMKRYAKKAGMAMFAEGATEGVQEGVNIAGELASGSNPDAMRGAGSRVGQAAMVGGILGGGAGVVDAAFHPDASPVSAPAAPPVPPVEPRPQGPGPLDQPDTAGNQDVQQSGGGVQDAQPTPWDQVIAEAEGRLRGGGAATANPADSTTNPITEVPSGPPGAVEAPSQAEPVAAGVEIPQPSVAPAASPQPEWLREEIGRLNDIAEKAGVADKVEQLSADRLTAKEVATRLGVDKDVVLAVRARRAIPSMDTGAEFEQWLGGYKARTTAPNNTGSPPEVAAVSTGSADAAASALPGPSSKQEKPNPPVKAELAANDVASSFTTSRGSIYKVDGTATTRTKFDGSTHPASSQTVYVTPSVMEDVQQIGAGQHTTVRMEGGLLTVSSGHGTERKRLMTVPFGHTPAVGLHPVEVWAKSPTGEVRWHIGDAISSIKTEGTAPAIPAQEASRPTSTSTPVISSESKPSGVPAAESMASPSPAAKPHLAVTPTPNLTPEQHDAEASMSAVAQDQQASDKLYNGINVGKDNTEGGKIVSTDLARHLSPLWKNIKDRLWLEKATVAVAKAWSRDRIMRDVKNPPAVAQGEQPVLLLTGGSPGSGKSTAVEGFKNQADKVWDSQMTNPDEAAKVIDEALAHGWFVQVKYVYRPFENTVPAILRRARSDNEGRPVLISDAIESRVRGQRAIAALAERYANNPMVEIAAVHNREGKAPVSARVSDVAEGGRLAYTPEELRSIADAELKRARQSGEHEEAILRAVAGDQGPGPADSSGRDGRPGTGREKQPAQPVQRAPQAPDGGERVGEAGGSGPQASEVAKPKPEPKRLAQRIADKKASEAREAQAADEKKPATTEDAVWDGHKLVSGVVDFTAHKHPVMAVPCPSCIAKVDQRCVRPSEHVAPDFHAERKKLADQISLAQGDRPILKTDATKDIGFGIWKYGEGKAGPKGKKPLQQRFADKRAGVDKVAASEPQPTQPAEPPKSEAKQSPTLFDELEAKLDAIAKKAKDEIKKTTIKRGRNTGSTTLISDMGNTAILVAALVGKGGVKVTKAGLRTTLNLRETARKTIAEYAPHLARHTDTVTHMARRLIMASKTETGLDPERFETAAADLMVSTERKQRGTSKVVKEATGLTDTSPKVSEADALAAGMKRQQAASSAGFKAGEQVGKLKAQSFAERLAERRTSKLVKNKNDVAVPGVANERRDAKTITRAEALKAGMGKARTAASLAYRAARREAGFELRELRGRLTDKARRDAMIEKIKARGVTDDKVAREQARRAIEAGVRKQAVRVIRDNVPRKLWGNYLTAIRDAKSTLALASLLNRVQKDLAAYEVRRALKAAEIAVGSQKAQAELEPELRDEVDRAAGVLRRIKRAVTSAGISDELDAGKIVAAAGSPVPPRTSVSVDQLEVMRDELGSVVNAVLSARHQQDTMDRVRIRGELKAAHGIREQITSRLDSRPELDKGDTPQAREASWLMKTLRRRTNWDVMMRMLDGFKKGGPAVRLFQEVLKGRRTSLELDHAFRDKLGTLATDHGWKSLGHLLAEMSGTLGDGLQKSVKVNVGGFDTLTMGQASYIYAASTDEGFRARLKMGQKLQFRNARTDETFKLTLEDLDTVAAALPAEVRAFIDDAKALYDSHYFDGLSRVNKVLKGYFLDKVQGYWGIKLNRDFSELRGVPTSWRGNYIRAQEESGFMQERLGPSKTPILIGDFGIDLMLRSKSAATVVGKAETTKLLTQTLLHPDVVKAVTAKFGVDTIERIKRRIALYSGGDIFNPSDSAARRLLSMWSRAKTQLWVWTWARNAFSGSLRVLNEIGVTDMAKAGLTPSWDAWQRLKAASPELRERWDSGGVGSFYDASGADVAGSTFKEASGATLKNLFDMMSGIGTFQISRISRGGEGAWKSWGRVLDSMTAGNFFDACGAIIAFKHFLKLAPANLTEAQRERWAARHATRLFERVSNTSTIEYANDVQLAARDSVLTASLVPFTGDTAKSMSMIFEAVGKARASGDWGPVVRVVAVLAGAAAASALVSVLRGLILGDDKDKALLAGGRRLTQELVSNAPGGTVLSQGATKIYDALTGKKSHDPSVLEIPLVEVINTVASAVMDGVEGLRRQGKPKATRKALSSMDLYVRALGKAARTVGEGFGAPVQYYDEIKRGIEGWSN